MSTPNLSGDFAVSLWFKANSLNPDISELITNPNNGSGGFGVAIGDSGTTLYINSPNVFPETLCSYSFSTGTWYHIVISRNNGAFAAWINGVNQNVTYQSTYDFSGPIALGWDNNISGFAFDGTIDEVGIWTKFLTSQNVATLYSNGVGNQYPFTAPPSTLINGVKAYWKLDETSGTRYDSTLNLHDLIDNGGVASGSGIINNDAVFDGTNYLELPALDSESNATWTSSQWVKFNNPVTGSYQVFSGLIPTLGMQVYLRPDGAIEVALYGNSAVSYNTGYQIPDTNWHHIVVTGNSDGTVIVYVDGVSVFSNTTAGDVIAITNTSGGSLGRENSGNWPITAAMDEVGIWSRVLSPSEVADLYNGGYGMSYPFIPTSGLSLWLDASDSNTVSKSALSPVPLIEYTADGNTSLLMHFDGYNGSTTFTDSSVNNRTFTAASNGAIVSTTNSKFGGASLQMNSGYLTAPSDASLGFDGDFTIECWVYLNYNDIGYQWFVNTSENGQNQTGWILYTEGNNLLSFLAHNPNSSGWSFGLQGPQPPANEWFHYAIVRSGSTLKMFVNGVDVNATSFFGSNFSQPVAYGDTVSIGNYVFVDIPLNGFIDEVRVSKGIARFPSTFVNPAANGDSVVAWLDKSGNDNHATQSNSSLRPVLSANTINGKSTVRFDGSTQYLTDTVAGIDGSHTVFIVANRRGAASGDGYEVPLSYGGILVDYGFPFAFKSNSTFASYPMYFRFGQSGYIDNVSSYSNDTTYIASLPINTQTLTWPFVVNGVSLGSAIANSFTPNGNNNIIIGKQGNPSRLFNGDVAEVLIYNRVLTDVEKYDVETYLNEKYNAYTVPSIVEDGLVLWLDAGDSRSYPGTGSTWYDLSPSNNNGTLNGNVTHNGDSGGAMNLDGFNGYINFGSYTPANESFTLEIAFTWNDYDTANVQFLFAGNQEKLELHTGGDTGTNGIRFIPSCYPGSSVDESNLITSGVNHITVVWNAESGISEIYKNGVFVTSASPRTGCGITSLQDLNIGRRADGTFYFSGDIHITRLYDRVLNSTEITRNFDASSARFGL